MEDCCGKYKLKVSHCIEINVEQFISERIHKPNTIMFVIKRDLITYSLYLVALAKFDSKRNLGVIENSNDIPNSFIHLSGLLEQNVFNITL